MKVAIVGYEIEGRAAYTYWHKKGADITICDLDTNKQLPDGVESQLGEYYLSNLYKFDLIIRTPGLNPRKILDVNPDVKDKITTNNDVFLENSPTKHIIGVTGTKGKGTTCTLITKILEASNKDVFLGGNIGTPCLEFIDKLDENSWVVLELSSFMLSDLKHSTAIAVCLTIAPEHLNWHDDMDDYILSKAHLFEHQQPNDLAIYYGKNDTSREIANYGRGLKMPYFIPPGAHIRDGTIVIDNETVCQTSDLKLIGEHNWQNVCAAVTVTWQIVQSISLIRTVLTTFTGLEHRLEFVRELDNIKFYDDSYASGPGSSMAAIEAIKQMKVMIMGGSDRGLPLNELAGAVQNNAASIRKLVLIGESASRLAAELDKVGFANYVIEPSQEIQIIVSKARSVATNGDAVILSPGFPSFDMFKNFTERGIQFKSAVNAL